MTFRTGLLIFLMIVTIVVSVCLQSSNASLLSKTTDKGSIDIRFEPSPSQITSDELTQMKISFMQPTSEQIQPHIDYDLVIIDNSTNKPIFQASNQTGQPGLPLHTAESIITVPFNFPHKGPYSIKIPVYGILFNPIAPESAIFDVDVQ